MNDDLVAVGVPLFGMILDHVVADADHHVGSLKAKGNQVRLQADGAQRQFMGKGNAPLAMKVVATGMRNTSAKLTRESRRLADNTVTGQDNGASALGDDARGLFDFEFRGAEV